MSNPTININNALQIIQAIQMGGQDSGPNSDLPHYESNMEFLDKGRQIRNAEDRLLKALENGDDALYDTLINPATGLPYTEAEKAEAIQNARERRLYEEQRITHPERFDENGNPLTYADVQQRSSHNSYKREEIIFEQYKNQGVRSFELDIRNSRDGEDFPIRHDNIGPDFGNIGNGGHYPNLSDGLADIAAIHEYDSDHDVITLHVDIKEFLVGDAHSEDDFDSHNLDRVLKEYLGDTLYTPEDFMDSTNTDSLADAHSNGMPTLVDLEGKVMVVMTGDTELLEAYQNGTENPVGFISPKPEFDNGTFVRNPDAIFYNMKIDDIDDSSQILDQDYVVRVYGANDDKSYEKALEAGVHHIGTDDISPGDMDWQTRVSNSITDLFS